MFINADNGTEIDWRDVMPSPVSIIVKAQATGGSPYTKDTISIHLKGAFTLYALDNVMMSETHIDSDQYESDIITLQPPCDYTQNNTVSVVETHAWGDGDEFLRKMNPFGLPRGQAHGLGEINRRPAASISAIRAAGYEKIALVPEIATFANDQIISALFIECQAKWFLYSGEGLSDSYCIDKGFPPERGGFIDLYDSNRGCDQVGCYPDDIEDDSWADVETVIFAGCSMFERKKWYGKKWFQKEGPDYFLGYRKAAPGIEASDADVAIIRKWKELVDQGEDQAVAWMDANGASRSWNASAYDKRNKKYWFFPFGFVFKYGMELDVDDPDFVIATSGGSDESVVYKPEDLEATVIAQNHINLSWNRGRNPSESTLQYGIFRDNEVIAVTPNTTYEDYSIESSKNYCYQISAFLDDEISERSEQACAPASDTVSVDDLPPSPPTNVRMEMVSE